MVRELHHVMPNFIVLGAQKAGSTYLAEALRAHPDIFMPAEEVPAFEDPDYERGGIEKLQQKLAGAGGVAAVGIKRAALLAREECPLRIAEHIPDARLIAILRNPIDRAVSSLFNLMHGGKAPILPVDEALTMILDGTMQRGWPMSQLVLEYGLYQKHLDRYLEHFDRKQMLILLHDDLRADAIAVVRRMYEFLGVEAGYQPSTLQRRPMAAPYSLSRLRILRAMQPLHSTILDDGSRVYRKPGVVAASMRVLSGALDRVVLKPLFNAPAPKPSPDVRRRLLEYYSDDITALQRLLDRDLSSWLHAG